MNTVYLVGSEDVRRAGGDMIAAAEQMSRAATQIEDALHRHQNFMENWLQDLSRIMGAQ